MTTETFESLGLCKPCLKAIETMGFSEPTPVQAKAIPPGIAKRDVLAAAQTGTGKTLAYLLPIFHRMIKEHAKPDTQGSPQALILAPTRELAQQISENARTIGTACQFRTLTIIGGKKYTTQVNKLKRGCDVLIATPGRLLDLANQKALSLKHLRYLVLDEVDRMMDMGFWPSVSTIVRMTPKIRQTFLLSATLTADVQTKAENILKNPAVVEIAHKGEVAETVHEYLLPVAERQKKDLLVALLQEKGAERVIVFTRTKQSADSCARHLKKASIKADSIHADKPQGKRDRALKSFREGKMDVLVATDVLARGIDITEVSYVVNLTVPEVPEDYIHRIGRTGRAGEIGAAYTFLSPDQLLELREIEYLIGHLLETYDVAGFTYTDDRLLPNPKRPTKRASRQGSKRRRPSLRKR